MQLRRGRRVNLCEPDHWLTLLHLVAKKKKLLDRITCVPFVYS